MPRPRKDELSAVWKVHIPATIAGAVENELFDHILNKPKYGAKSGLISSLLEQWLQKDSASRAADILEHTHGRT